MNLAKMTLAYQKPFQANRIYLLYHHIPNKNLEASKSKPNVSYIQLENRILFSRNGSWKRLVLPLWLSF